MARRRILHSEYVDLTPSLTRLQRALIEQLEQLVSHRGFTLGVPIESRIKAWNSIAEKLERKRLKPKSLGDIDDLLGLRIIFLFQRDIEPFHQAMEETFTVYSSEDTSQRLTDAQFGYRSRHYVIGMPTAWESIPSIRGLTAHKAEVQVRTLAQHIWAAASHKLQYKREDNVPLPLRRSIYRVSALLETVDLEFTRVLEERDEYVKAQAKQATQQDLLNVTIIESVLDEFLPAKNKDRAAEDYSDLLTDLQHFGISTRGALASLTSTHARSIQRADAAEVQKLLDDDDDEDNEPGESRSERLARGVFFTHVGLARQALCEQFGETVVRDWLSHRGSPD